MGIYLPNMEMPRKGQMLVIFPDGTSYVCFNGMRERLTQTTAVSVPLHGRCIDVDALIKSLSLDEDDAENGASLLMAIFIEVLKAAPTIIQTEEKQL